MIKFPKRAELVKQLQGRFGLLQDGLDGSKTWGAITNDILGGKAASALGFPLRGGVRFLGRTQTVSAVQRKLQVGVDGRDGAETWGALMAHYFPIPTKEFPTPVTEKYPEVVRGRTPNRNAGTNDKLGIVVHHCAGSHEGTVSWCLQSGTFAAYHCTVRFDGSRSILALDDDRCHHAGKSTWRGRSLCNHFMLAISVNGNTNTGARRPHAHLTEDEVASVVEWIRAKQALYNIPDSEITHHRVVSPGRKDDLSLQAWRQIQDGLNGLYFQINP